VGDFVLTSAPIPSPSGERVRERARAFRQYRSYRVVLELPALSPSPSPQEGEGRKCKEIQHERISYPRQRPEKLRRLAQTLQAQFSNSELRYGVRHLPAPSGGAGPESAGNVLAVRTHLH